MTALGQPALLERASKSLLAIKDLFGRFDDGGFGVDGGGLCLDVDCAASHAGGARCGPWVAPLPLLEAGARRWPSAQRKQHWHGLTWQHISPQFQRTPCVVNPPTKPPLLPWSPCCCEPRLATWQGAQSACCCCCRRRCCRCRCCCCCCRCSCCAVLLLLHHGAAAAALACCTVLLLLPPPPLLPQMAMVTSPGTSLPRSMSSFLWTARPSALSRWVAHAAALICTLCFSSRMAYTTVLACSLHAAPGSQGWGHPLSLPPPPPSDLRTARAHRHTHCAQAHVQSRARWWQGLWCCPGIPAAAVCACRVNKTVHSWF